MTIAAANEATLDARRRIALAIKKILINNGGNLSNKEIADLVEKLAEAHSRLWLIIDNDEPVVIREDAKGNLEVG